MISTLLMRVALAAALLTAPIVAFADFQGTATTAVRPPLVDSSLANPNGFNVVAPTGVAATDFANLSAAFATSATRTVLLMPGVFQVCQPGLSIPADGVVMGHITTGWAPAGASFLTSRATLTCANGGTYSNGDGIIIMHDRSKLSGVTVYGLQDVAPSLQVSGIKSRNMTAIQIENNIIMRAYDNIDRFSDGAVPGDTISISQLADIHGNYILSAARYGYYGDCINSGGVDDERIHDNNFVSNVSAEIYASCMYTTQVINNRIEDGNVGIDVISGCCSTFNNNLIDRETAGIKVSNALASSIIGNQIHGFPACGGCVGIWFYGSGSNTVIAGPNSFANEDGGDYFVSSGLFLNNSTVIGAGSLPNAYSREEINRINVFTPQNALGGGAGLTTFWTGQDATLATGAATDPYGGSTAARLTEDTANTAHNASQSDSFSSGGREMSVFFKTGSGAARGLQLAAYNGAFANSVKAKATSACVLTSAVAGTGALLQDPVATTYSNGWCRISVKYTLGATTGSVIYLEMMNGANTTYVGDGTANVLVWNPIDKGLTTP